uniref:RING-type domain-containing protein n=1 Tax=Ditylenchus dipsaci TaxID=166011 RepID=A0A915CVD7_9BILA
MSLMGVGGSEQKRLKEKLGVNIGFNFEKDTDGNIEIGLTGGTVDKYEDAERNEKNCEIEYKDKDKENVYVEPGYENNKKSELPTPEPPSPTFECSICCDAFPLRKGVPCHSLEESDDDEETHSNETGLAKGGIGLPCMQPKCKHALLMSEIRWYLDEATVSDWMQDVWRNQLNQLTFMVLLVVLHLCPREYNNNSNHFGKTCEQLYLEEFEQERQEKARKTREARQATLRAEQAVLYAEATERARYDAEAKEARRLEKNLADNRLSENAIAKLRKCARCGTPVEKNGGCNHMTCKPPGGCGSEFCYACGAIWSSSHNCRSNFF